MKSARFRERLLHRVAYANMTLTEQTVSQLEIYYLLLSHWNKRINLSAFPLDTMSDQAIDRVLVEPLVAANVIPTGSPRWWDLGSGGGSPALPMKIVRPDSDLTLVEARSRKAAFLREAVRELALSRVDVITGRFEEVAGAALDGIADLVTVRAVRIDDGLLSFSCRLLKQDGELLLFATRDTPIPSTHGFTLDRIVHLIPGGRSELVVLRAASS